jgi:hypothetical protein
MLRVIFMGVTWLFFESIVMLQTALATVRLQSECDVFENVIRR